MYPALLAAFILSFFLDYKDKDLKARKTNTSADNGKHVA